MGKKMVKCARCKGKGTIYYAASSKKCPNCGGSGQVEQK